MFSTIIIQSVITTLNTAILIEPDVKNKKKNYTMLNPKDNSKRCVLYKMSKVNAQTHQQMENNCYIADLILDVSYVEIVNTT